MTTQRTTPPIDEDRHKTISTCYRTLGAVAVFSLIINVLTLTVPLYSLQTFDRVLTSRSEETLLYLTLISVGALGVLAMLDGARAQVLSRAGAVLEHGLGSLAFPARGSKVPSTEQAAISTLRDLAVLRLFLGSPACTALFDAPTVPIYVVALFFISPSLAWVTLGGALVLCALAMINLVATRRLLDEANASSARAVARMQAQLRCADAIKAMGMRPRIADRWKAVNADVLDRHVGAADRISLAGAASRFARLLLQVVIMGFGALLVIEHDITGGMMIAVSLIAARALAPIDYTISSWVTVAQAREAWRRVSRAVRREKAVAEPIALPKPTGQLVVDRATFKGSRSSDPVLKGISFSLESGEVLGVVGPTASGKSTLLRLIVGAQKCDNGSVRLDGADISSWPESDAGRHVGYLPQDVQLMPGTVAENIARWTVATPEAIVSAARRAGIHEMILQMPLGYETELDDGSFVLSGGQRQRLGLARSLFGSPALLVLDEPNANLDATGETALMQALGEARAIGTTVVLVTHRPTLLQHVDKVLILRNGQAETFGKRDEILEKTVQLARRLEQPAPMPRATPKHAL